MNRFSSYLPILGMIAVLSFGTFSVIMIADGVYVLLNVIAVLLHTISFIGNAVLLVKFNFMGD